MIPLNIPQGQRWIELGCGEQPHPACHVRVDVRDIPGVTHFSCDLGKFPWPIGDGHFDGVFSCFVIEHVSWRAVRSFVKELFRILRPGGRAVIVGPNTEAQMRHLLATQDWEDAGSMLFGGQDYPENSHRAAFSPSFYEKVFTEAGFVNVVTQAWGVKMTDMIVEATKPEMSIDQIRHEHMQKNIGPQEVQFVNEHGQPLPPATPSVREILEQHAGPLSPSAVKVGWTREVKEPDKVVVQGDSSVQEQRAKEAFGHVDLVEVTDEERDAAPGTPEWNRRVEKDELNELRRQDARRVKNLSTLAAKAQEEPTFVEDLRKLREDPPQPVQEPHVVDELRGVIARDVAWAVPSIERRQMFGRDYFDGGRGKWGGYREGYRDFPWNETTARLVLARRPESVLELGCARGYLLKRLQDAGVNSLGVDISKHAYMTRVADNILNYDLLDMPWTAVGGKDLCLSLNFLEHVPETTLPPLINKLDGYCKRHLHGVTVEGKDDGSDRTRCTIKPLDWWQKLFKEHCKVPFEVVDVDTLRNGQLPPEVLQGDSKVKLNWGSFTTMFYHGWLNLDVHDLHQYAQNYGFKYAVHDMRRPMHQFGTGTVDLIYSAHALEHITYAEGLAFLKECRRVLKPETGAMRLIVPDASLLTSLYNSQKEAGSAPFAGRGLSEFDEINVGCAAQPTAAGKLWSMLGEGHKAAYDGETLVKMLEQAGFNARVAQFRREAFDVPCGVNGISQILRETQDVLPSCSLYVDAVPKVG